jgi:glycosyltransferase involved in cell wall biosynthesis
MTQQEAMRVLLMTETFSPEIGGGETQAELLASALVRRGHTVTVLTRRSRADTPREEQYGGVRVVRVAPTGSGRLRKWGLVATTPAPLLGWRDQIDLIFVSGFRILGIPAIAAARMLDKPCVLKADSNGEMSGEFFRPGLVKSRMRFDSMTVRSFLSMRNRMLRGASGFVAISSEIEHELMEHGIQAGRVQRIPNGVDTTRFRPASPEEKAALRQRLGLPSGPIAVYSGRFVTYKGLPLLLRVWDELRERLPSATLLLVGEGGHDMHACEAEMRQYVADRGMQSSVRFTGPVTAVEDWLRASDVFALPTENEAFGLSLVEAMACGIAVVATRVGGIRDIMVNGTNGLFIRAGDFEALRSSLEMLLTDPVSAAAMGQQARANAVRRFGEDAVAVAYEDLFRSVLRERLRAVA